MESFDFLAALGGKVLVAAVEFAMLLGVVYLVSRNSKMFPGTDDVAVVNNWAGMDGTAERRKTAKEARFALAQRNGVVTAGALIALALLIGQ